MAIVMSSSIFLFNIFFISYLGLGLKGFMFSIIASDLCSAIFISLTTKLWRYFSIKAADKDKDGKINYVGFFKRVVNK